MGAAEPLGEHPGQVLHRLGRVEVRHVPEPVELFLRRGERRGVAVPEADDGDPGDQVEVALAVVGDQPGPSPSTKVTRAGVRRQQRRSRRATLMRPPPSTPIAAGTPPGLRSRPRRRASGRCRPRGSRRRAARRRLGADRVDDLAVEDQAVTSVRKIIRSTPRPTASADGRLVGVRVQRPDGDRSDDRDQAGVERRQDLGRAGRDRVAGEAQLRHGLGPGRSRRRRAARRAAPIAAQTAALTAASESRTITITSGVVTRRPPTNSTGRPARAPSPRRSAGRRRGRRTPRRPPPRARARATPLPRRRRRPA